MKKKLTFTLRFRYKPCGKYWKMYKTYVASISLIVNLNMTVYSTRGVGHAPSFVLNKQVIEDKRRSVLYAAVDAYVSFRKVNK